MDALVPEMMQAAGVTEELKAYDQMAWIGLMNNYIVRTVEIILADLMLTFEIGFSVFDRLGEIFASLVWIDVL